MALENNSIFTNLSIRELEHQKTLAKEKADNRFTSSVSLGYGLNGKNETFIDSYQKFGEKQNVNISFSIPLIDWGEGRGAITVAMSSLEAERIRIKQERLKFEQGVSTKVHRFNLQRTLVENSAIADTIAEMGYEISYDVFKLGELDVMSLNQAQSDKEIARYNYISKLEQYWTYWYGIRKLTLYDFKNHISLSKDFDKLISN
jgi:outer membrane protein TolC